MRFNKLNVSAVALAATLLIAASAAGASEKKEGGEAEGGGGHETSAGEGKEQREYTDKTSRMTSLGNRIEEAEKKFKELVHHKAEAGTNEAKQAIIKEMVELANQRNKDVDAYNKLKTELTYRYPYQGEKLNRRYQTQSRRTVEEMESAGGLDELLTRTKKAVERKFAPFIEDEPKSSAKAKVAQPAEEKPVRLKLEK